MRRTFDWTQAQLAFSLPAQGIGCWIDDATNAGCTVMNSSGLFALGLMCCWSCRKLTRMYWRITATVTTIAVADSLTDQLLALKPLIDQEDCRASPSPVCCSASAQGKKRSDALAGQSAKLLNGIPIDEDDFFGRQLAFNMLPLLPDRERRVREERRIVDEVRKICRTMA